MLEDSHVLEDPPTYTCTVCNNFTREKESDVLKHLEETCLYQARTRELDEFLMQKVITSS